MIVQHCYPKQLIHRSFSLTGFATFVGYIVRAIVRLLSFCFCANLRCTFGESACQLKRNTSNNISTRGHNLRKFPRTKVQPNRALSLHSWFSSLIPFHLPSLLNFSFLFSLDPFHSLKLKINHASDQAPRDTITDHTYSHAYMHKHKHSMHRSTVRSWDAFAPALLSFPWFFPWFFPRFFSFPYLPFLHPGPLTLVLAPDTSTRNSSIWSDLI